MLVKQMTDCTNAGPDSICTVKLMAEESGEKRRGKTEESREIKVFHVSKCNGEGGRLLCGDEDGL